MDIDVTLNENEDVNCNISMDNYQKNVYTCIDQLVKRFNQLMNMEIFTNVTNFTCVTEVLNYLLETIYIKSFEEYNEKEVQSVFMNAVALLEEASMNFKKYVVLLVNITLTHFQALGNEVSYNYSTIAKIKFVETYDDPVVLHRDIKHEIESIVKVSDIANLVKLLTSLSMKVGKVPKVFNKSNIVGRCNDKFSPNVQPLDKFANPSNLDVDSLEIWEKINDLHDSYGRYMSSAEDGYNLKQIPEMAAFCNTRKSICASGPDDINCVDKCDIFDCDMNIPIDENTIASINNYFDKLSATLHIYDFKKTFKHAVRDFITLVNKHTPLVNKCNILITFLEMINTDMSGLCNSYNMLLTHMHVNVLDVHCVKFFQKYLESTFKSSMDGNLNLTRLLVNMSAYIVSQAKERAPNANLKIDVNDQVDSVMMNITIYIYCMVLILTEDPEFVIPTEYSDTILLPVIVSFTKRKQIVVPSSDKKNIILAQVERLEEFCEDHRFVSTENDIIVYSNSEHTTEIIVDATLDNIKCIA